MTATDFEQALESAAQQMVVLSCPAERSDTVRFFKIYSNAVTLLPTSQQDKLAAIAGQIVASFSGPTPVAQVTLIGHADADLVRERREPGFMLRISGDRAVTVMRALQQSVGLASSRIKWFPVGVGATALAVPNPRTEAERACNRRVEVVLSHSDCSAAQKEQVDLAKAAAVHFMRTRLERREPAPRSVNCFTPGKMPFVCDIGFSNEMVLQVEVSANHLRVLVSIAEREPNLVGRVCTYQYKCLSSGMFVFSLSSCP
jgi:outer membrane protein OmpA-like peptidoglycan-associated protein